MRHLGGHPNIARLVDAFEDEGAVHMITELCTGGGLLDLVMARVRASAVSDRSPCCGELLGGCLRR
jgi:serine/threonine protein kinase